MQDSFLTIFNKISSYKNKGSFEGWLKRVTINTALQKYRKKKTVQLVDEIPEQEATTENKKYTVLNADLLLSFVQQLPNKYRLVFSLFVLDGYTHKEISKLLQISEGTSKSNLSRARTILKNLVETHQNKQQ